MYHVFYKFESDPFAMPSNLSRVYYSNEFLEVIYYFKYGFKSDESIFLVTGDYGSGKTTFCKRLVRLFETKKDIDFVFISTPNHDYAQILRKIAAVLNVAARSQEELQDDVFRHFEGSEHSRKFYVVIDDANELDTATLSKLRFLVDYCRNGFYPFRLILFAHTSLLETLRLPELIPLDQRIRRRARLEPLGIEETRKYIQFRLSKAGGEGGPTFTESGVRKIHEITGGNPRLIHTVCDACLILGAMEGLQVLDGSVVARSMRVSGLSWEAEGERASSIGSNTDRREPAEERYGAAASFPGGSMRKPFPEVPTRASLMIHEAQVKARRKKGRGLRLFIFVICVFVAAMIVLSLLDFRSFLGGLF